MNCVVTREIVSIDHVAIKVVDIERSLRFYHDQLGLPICDYDRFVDGELPFVSLTVGGGQLVLYPKRGSDIAIDDKEHVCLVIRSASDDSQHALEDLVTDLVDGGITIEEKPKLKLGAIGVGWSVTVRDPDDRLVELKMY